MKSRYYEAELAYLREQGREFSKVFPSTAGSRSFPAAAFLSSVSSGGADQRK